MTLNKEKVRREKLYVVGYEETEKCYMLAIVITWISWYNRYYLISEEEYNWFDSDITKLDQLAEECFQMGACGERFLYSERMEENR